MPRGAALAGGPGLVAAGLVAAGPAAALKGAMQEKLEAAALRAAAGDEAAFRDLVRETSARLFRLAAGILGDAAEAEDALQEAFTRAHAALSRGRYQSGRGVEGWLYQITANAALDALKARRRWWRRARPEAAPEAAAAGDALARLRLRELSRALGDLPPEQRAALILKEVEGLTSREVADILGCSEGAVEQRLLRARAALRERLRDE
jgi:RNA polymerase sigma-70 factor, ECF subfamily